MLRSIHRSGRRFVPLFNNTATLRRDASALSPAAPPSTTTTVLLRKLAPTVTETTLKASIGAIKELQIRKIEVEPGCAFHFTNEAEANFATKILHLHHQKNCTTQITNSTMPSLLLQNIPATMYEQHLEKCFSKFNPKVVRLTGLPMMQVNAIFLYSIFNLSSLYLFCSCQFPSSHSLTSRLFHSCFSINAHADVVFL